MYDLHRNGLHDRRRPRGRIAAGNHVEIQYTPTSHFLERDGYWNWIRGLAVCAERAVPGVTAKSIQQEPEPEQDRARHEGGDG